MNNLQILRERTHLGLSDCKKALTQSNDDLEKAIEILQSQGLKKVDDLIIPLEGEVFTSGEWIIELNCQTDFGARSELFQQLIQYIKKELLSTKLKTVQEVKDQLTSLLTLPSNALREKICIRRLEKVTDDDHHMVVGYNHPGGKIASILSYVAKDSSPEMEELLSNICMHIAATESKALDSYRLDQKLVEEQKAKYLTEVGNKPEAIRTKIVEGKLQKYYSEVCLVNQEAIWAPKTTIQSHLDKYPELILSTYIRYFRGEMI